MCRTYMSSMQGFNRWRWKKKMERGGVVSSKRVNYKKSWLSRRGGKKQRKLKSWLGYCGERRVWSLGSGRDQTGQRWSFYSLKETFALSVTSGFFGLTLYCLRKWDHKLPFASCCIRLGQVHSKEKPFLREQTHIYNRCLLICKS